MIRRSPEVVARENARWRRLFEEGGESLLRKMAEEQARKLWPTVGAGPFYKTEDEMAASFLKGFLKASQA